MDLMFSSKAEHHENALRPCQKWHWQNPSFRKMEVRKARQIAAENAAWWGCQIEMVQRLAMGDGSQFGVFKTKNGKRKIKHRLRVLNTKRRIAYEQVMAWRTVYRQGQLYARDTVKPFNPKYGETQ